MIARGVREIVRVECANMRRDANFCLRAEPSAASAEIARVECSKVRRIANSVVHATPLCGDRASQVREREAKCQVLVVKVCKVEVAKAWCLGRRSGKKNYRRDKWQLTASQSRFLPLWRFSEVHAWKA